MFCQEFMYVAKAVFLALMFYQVYSQECGRDTYSVFGMMLKGHIISSMKTSSPLECLWACNNDEECLSFNYVIVKDICELNSATKEGNPKHFFPSPNRYYVSVRDADECALGSHDCLANVASCINTFGSYSCACNHGFEGDGKTSCKITAPECTNYQTLNEANRKDTHVSVQYRCDSGISDGWYRFEGDAGTTMPTTCPPKYRCDTHAPGWLNGEHPTLAEGKVTRQVCFHWSSKCCYFSTDIEVRNCGEYYVYYYTTTPGCSLRFCGSD